MRVLILSCNTGQGHNSAAKALKEEFERGGHTCEMKNALSFISRIADEVISDGHVFVYRRFPKLFGVGYRFEERHSPKFICSQLRRGVGRLKEYLEQNPVDAIVCTHVFGAIMVNELRKTADINCYLSLVSTDYTCCPGCIESDADTYFIPHPKLKDEFSGNGIDSEKIVPFGIPVASQFFVSETKLKARKILGLSPTKRIVLVGGGSMGCGPIVRLSFLLSKKLPSDIVIVLCGTNSKLLKKIEMLGRNNIMAVPYTKKMSLYLDAADVYLSKAGGLTTAESIIKQIPLVYINAVPGCETRNIDFMTSNGFAAAAFSPEEAVDRAFYALCHPETVGNGIKNCRKALVDNPAKAICDYIMDRVEKNR